MSPKNKSTKLAQVKPKRGRPRRENAPSSADRKSAVIAGRQAVPRRECANRRRRNRLEKNPEAWLKWYLPEAYSRPFEKPHVGIIDGTMRAHKSGGRFVVAGERGIGKSAILWGLVLFLKLSGREMFPVCVPWADKALKRAFRFWRSALCFNERLADDYPEYCDPFRHAKGVPQRVATTTWEDTGNPTGGQLTVGEGLIVLPDDRGCIGGSTINGNIRGLNHPQDGGRILRPTIALLDDVQDRKVAKSPIQVDDTVAIIDGDVAGCGDPGKNLPLLMACNCIVPGDVSDHYLNSATWEALRIPCVEQWPDGWDDPESEVRELWDRLREKLEAGRGAPTFYRKHKRKITAGMKLSAPGTFRSSEGKKVDPLYRVIEIYFQMGRESFLAERQQAPEDTAGEVSPYTLTPEMILARVDKRKELDRPDWVSRVFASSDINPSYAITTTVVGFGDDHTAAVLWRGVHPLDIDERNMSPAEYAKVLFPELSKHGRFLANLPEQARPEAWGLDAGGRQFDAIVPYAPRLAQAVGFPCVPMTGRNGLKYTPYGKTVIKSTVRENCHAAHDVKAGVRRQWVAWSACYWGEIAQRAWVGDAGAPGKISLYHGPHWELARQVCNQRLMDKVDKGGRFDWTWKNLPGKHDYHDALAQCYALAAYNGVGTVGAPKPKPRRKQRRRTRHVAV